MSSRTLAVRSDLSETLVKQHSHELAQWAGEKLTERIVDVLAHFLLSHRSTHTRSAYARDVREYLLFMEELKTPVESIRQISEESILLWKDHLNEKHSRFDDSKRRISSASVARKLCTLSSLLDFALKRKLITENPMELVNRPKVRRQSHSAVLNEDELQLILNTARLRAEQFHAAAHASQLDEKMQKNLLRAETEWCIFVLLFTVGMRVSELCQLKLEDVSNEGDLVRLHLTAKGARKHSPLIHPESARVLANYISHFRAGASAEEPLFAAGRSRSGKILPIHRSTVFRMVRDGARRAGITRAFSPHGCRATLATQLHLAEVPLVEIQNLLNHAQVTTTQLYLHRINDLRESAALRLPWLEKKPFKPPQE